MTENSSDQEQTLDKEITLNYIDKLAETLSQIHQQRGRVNLIAQVLSVLLIAVAGGVVSLEGSYSLVGLGIEISIPAFLVAGGVILVALIAVSYTLASRAENIAYEIDHLYKSLDYVISDSQTIRGTFGASDVYSTLEQRMVRGLENFEIGSPPRFAVIYNAVIALI